MFNFSAELTEKAKQAEKMCAEQFAYFDETARYNGEKVLKAFIDNRVSERHLYGTTGYGYGDDGRDTLDRVFAGVFGAQKALVRHNFINGTHAISTALFGVLRPGDRLVSVTGTPYDTLKSVIGSFNEYGIGYSETPLLDFDALKRECSRNDCKAVLIQRSRGYSLREPVNIAQIGGIIKAVREVNKNAVIIVDNCYGEFVELKEPTEAGADLTVGSLIKNPGGGIARTGGYICGRGDLVERCAYRLNVPGIGAKAGCSLDENRNMYSGLFRAPETVANALKTSAFAIALMKLLGYECSPDYDSVGFRERTDIVSVIKMRGADELRAFCGGIQAGSPIDSFARPEPWDMPGYDCKVIMAAGTFVSGASAELSADAPLREPWAVWLQGGLTYASGRIGVMTAAERLLIFRLKTE